MFGCERQTTRATGFVHVAVASAGALQGSCRIVLDSESGSRVDCGLDSPAAVRGWGAGIYLVLSLLLATLCACAPARQQRITYARARPVVDDPAPPRVPAVAFSARALVPGMSGSPTRLRAPSESESADVGGASYDVIDRANRAAAQGPEEGAYFNAIQEYVYTPGTLYQLYTAPMRVTDVAMRPGERIIGQPASGDIVRWVLAVGKSIDEGREQQHVYLKPTRAGLHTNLVINTSQRSYFLELHSYKETYMAAVKWRYPQEELAKMAEDATDKATLNRASSPVVSLDQLNFGYRIRVVDGEPKWTPTQVFDDGRKTFIRFPAAMRVREAPALFVMRNHETQLVNYRVKASLYVVDRLLDIAELRVGQDEQEIVRIERE
jgi:P-type conjugative transfer protein TrbG